MMFKLSMVGVTFHLMIAGVSVVSMKAFSDSSIERAHKLVTLMNWHSAKPLPVALQEVYPAEFKGRIYVAGAFEKVKPAQATLAHLAASEKTYIYDDMTKEWLIGPNLPEPRHHLGLVSNNNMLYAIGGFDASKENAWMVKNSVYIYQEDSFKWRRGPDLPIPQGESVYGVVNDEVHVAGGRTLVDGQLVDTDKHWVLRNKKWESAAPLPLASNSAASVTLDNEWYVMGGRINALDYKNLATMHRYDPIADRWVKLAPMPQASAGLAAAVINDQIYVFGGEEYTYVYDENNQKRMKTRTFDSVWRYDIKRDMWSTESLKMTSTRHGLGAVTIDNKIYLLGGAVEAGATGTSANVEILSLERL
ncbi:hypothetical protein PCIT_a4265 [Pseudoalteromonas citrea]|uniref:Galactose oxidase n=2 Tax=Pseudoalteromonas citrea TaxID=43655 RepID=A0AAD4AIL3_9GAMM|nr:hypothetical protein [Pseudoalteromonas citrea]KAF7771207.1 hypothetical protein PCIT_a4265 [Pseudoalteromonas citrea]